MSIVLSVDFQRIAEECLRKWGVDSQIQMMIEESAELIQVLIKRHRDVNGATVEDVVSELVDVELMLGQMKNVYGLNQDMWTRIREEKLERLRKRLEEYR